MGHSAIAASTAGGRLPGSGMHWRVTSVQPDCAGGYGVLQINAEGVVVGCDAGASRIFGRPPETLTGCHVDTLLCLPDRGAMSNANPPLSQRQDRHIVAHRSDGAATAVEVICVEAMSEVLAIKLLLVRNAEVPDVQYVMASQQHPLHPPHVAISADASFGGGISSDGGSVFQRHLRQVLLRSAGETRAATLLFLDITDMADIVDLCGEKVAEMMRSNMEARINKCLRRGDVAACVEGEEFVAIIHDVNDGDVMRMVVDRITQAIRQPFLILGREFCLAGDIGTQLYAINGNKPQELLEHFDRAMQRACAGHAAGAAVATQLSS